MQSHIIEQPQSHRVPHFEQSTILIIDDDPAMVEVLRRRLARQHFQVIDAASGSQGLAMARERRPSLVVLDLRLPDIDGLGVCERMADDPQTSQIPVIILSGMERPDIIRRSRAAGCQYFVRKPYDPNALLLLIRSAIDESRNWETV